MKKIFLPFIYLIVFFLFFNSTYSQDSTVEYKYGISLTYGVYMPIGKFAAKTIHKANSGYAKWDDGPDINFQYHLYKNHYLSVRVLPLTNKFDNNAFASQLNAANPAYTFSLTSDPWKSLSVLLGVSDVYKLNKKKTLFFVNSAYLGFSGVMSPGLFITEKQIANNTVSNVVQNTSKAYPFTIAFDWSLKYKVGEFSSVLFSIGYLYAKPTFKNVTTINSTGSSTVSTFSQNMGVLLFRIGYLNNIEWGKKLRENKSGYKK